MKNLFFRIKMFFSKIKETYTILKISDELILKHQKKKTLREIKTLQKEKQKEEFKKEALLNIMHWQEVIFVKQNQYINPEILYRTIQEKNYRRAHQIAEYISYYLNKPKEKLEYKEICEITLKLMDKIDYTNK